MRHTSRRLRIGVPAALLAAIATVVIVGGASGKSTATPIKIGILSDCQGAFGAFDNQDLGGAIAALSQYAGAKPKNPNLPRAGFTGASVAGHPITLVGVGCSNDRADTAIRETRRLMEQLGANIMIGPYACSKAFSDGISPEPPTAQK